MTVCRGCYVDERVPSSAPGVVLILATAAPDPYVDHGSHGERCRLDQPHLMSECAEFDPPRPGYEPDDERLGPYPIPRLVRRWGPIFRKLAAR